MSNKHRFKDGRLRFLDGGGIDADSGSTFDFSDADTFAVPAGAIDAAAIDPAVSLYSANQITVISIENLSAGADIAARAEFVAPVAGATLSAIGILMKGSSAGIDNSNTAVITIKDGAGNTIVTKTYNTATQPPAANAFEDLGPLDGTHKVLTANEVVTATVTQGATADLPAFDLILEWIPVTA